VASSPKLFRTGAIGFIDWLGDFAFSRAELRPLFLAVESSSHFGSGFG
jgi:hypothetical protein